MNEAEVRKKVVALAKSYLGAQQGSALHKKIIDIFNKVKPDGWAMTYAAYWCAAFVSGIEIQAFGVEKAKKYFPLSANCPNIITKAKKMGIFVEKDSYIPKPADWILYDWQDNGKGDNTGAPDHVGIVEKVSKTTITIIEGNYKRADGVRVVAERDVEINGKYIRGFVTPKYSALADKKKTVDEIAKEVIDGKWSTGTERKKRLTEAGYDYNAVQKRVNELLKKKSEPKKKATKKKSEAKALVDLARKQLGNGYKKYCKAFGKNTSWCQIYMWWLCDKRKIKYLKDSFARHAAAWCKRHWKFVTMEDAKAGDFVFFTSTGKGNNKMQGKVTHVGLIRAKSPIEESGKNKGKAIKCYTIEGNVNGKEKSQQGSWRKHIVAKRTRKISYVWGIFRPPYKD